MGEQIDCPATDETAARIGLRSVSPRPGELPRAYDVWAEPSGWCSACRGQGTRVVMMGYRDGVHVGICSYCLARAADAMRSSDTSGDTKGLDK